MDSFAARSQFAGAAFNLIQPGGRPSIHLRLRFRDPDGRLRDLPQGLPVRVRFTESPLHDVVDMQVGAGGRLTLDARESPPWKSIALEFQSAEVPYVLCEVRGSPESPPWLVPASGLSPATAGGERYFALPRQWSLGQADWSPPPQFAGNGSFSPPEGLIHHTTPAAADIGSLPSPIDFFLEPHWKYVRFEYFDRYFGNDSLDSPPRTGLRRRVTIPPVAIEGFRTDPAAAGAPDTHSNWTIAGPQRPDALQCLPWIVQRQADGTALSAAMDGAHVGLRFRTSTTKVTAVHSQDADTRVLVDLSPPMATPASPPPGLLDARPERLRYYDLPRMWKSAGYFARGVPSSPPLAPAPAGQFFEDLNAGDLARSDNPATPLIFSLDDIVLTDDAFRQIAVANTDRVTLFHHRFANRVLSPPGVATGPLSNEGIHAPGALVDIEGYPYSDIARRRSHYIADYPDWTRLVLAQGNLFDVFGHRTIDDAANSVIGARAAVRWVDAAAIAAPGTNVNPKPPLVTTPYAAIQPFYYQKYLMRNLNPAGVGVGVHDDWTAALNANYTNGRYDIALLRCCDVQDGNETAVVFRYHRFAFDFVTQISGTVANAAVLSPPADRMDWARMMVDGVRDRWNGHDAHNPVRAWILPSPPLLPLRSHVLTFVQYLAPARSHYEIKPGPPSITSSMNPSGTGKLRVNAVVHDAGGVGNDAWGEALSGKGLASAHESGHCGSMPDEYRPKDSLELNWESNHVLGNPYIRDLRGLMKRNWYLRSRYFWHAAEWMRTIPGLASPPLIVQHGATETNYELPFYRHAAANPARSYVNWPVRINFRQRQFGDMSNFDSLLYLLGDDEYSNTVLPDLITANRGIPRAPGDRVDGILVVLLRVLALYTTAGPLVPSDARKKLFHTRVQTRFDERLNDRYCAAFTIPALANAPVLRRCLLYFVPCFTTANVAGTPHHIEVDVRVNGATNYNDIAPPNPKTMQLRLQAPFNNVSMGNLGDTFFGYCCRVLGLTDDADPLVAGSYAAPASYVNIVQTISGLAVPVVT